MRKNREPLVILTRPISDTAMVLGKFFASVVLVAIVIIPAFIFVYSVSSLGNPAEIWTGQQHGVRLSVYFSWHRLTQPLGYLHRV